VNSDIKQRWVSALRSGNYTQGRAGLRTEGKHCCLGVLCDLYPNSDERWELNTDEDIIGDEFDGYSELPPEYVAEWAGLDEIDPIVKLPYNILKPLSYLNDELRYGFNTIADIIEEQL
jgi:hypothetical protein